MYVFAYAEKKSLPRINCSICNEDEGESFVDVDALLSTSTPITRVNRSMADELGVPSYEKTAEFRIEIPYTKYRWNVECIIKDNMSEDVIIGMDIISQQPFSLSADHNGVMVICIGTKE